MKLDEGKEPKVRPSGPGFTLFIILLFCFHFLRASITDLVSVVLKKFHIDSYKTSIALFCVLVC